MAERQAHRFHALMQIAEPPFPEQAIEYLPRVHVRYVQTRRLDGALSWSRGSWHILVNTRDVTWGRARFSLCHEYGHLVSHPVRDVIYRDSRTESAHVTAERAADYFAACLLMPRTWVKRRYFDEGIHDPRVLARQFQVSTTAMRYRLDQLGLYEPLEVAT